MAIPKHIIEEIKHSLRLSEVLSQYITLRRHGKEQQALCPFHKEKSPSFTVSDEKGFYHCFGCGEHGDAISFLMKHENLQYPEAIRQLADQAGIFIPEEKPEDIAKQNHTDTLFDVMDEACNWYVQNLQGEDGWAAREYITRRGLKPEIVQRFKLGFVSKERSGLKKYLLAKGFGEKQLFDVGLLTKPDDGDSYDKFRSRLMFPILGASGRVIAFGGRLISDDPESRAPKYLNSPETELFHKRKQLYVPPATSARGGGLFNKARESGRLLVVEGYMDVIACVQAGFEEVVATLGTAFTEEHSKMLWRAVDEPVLCLDGDSAGSRAMLRAAELAMPLLTPGKSVRFMLMPKGDDPDTLLKREGKGAFEALVKKAIPLHEAMFNAYGADVDMRDPTKRAGLEQQLEKIAGRIEDATTRQHMRQYFKEAMWQQGRPKRNAKGARGKAPVKQSLAQGDPLDKLNRAVLKLLISHPNLLQYGLAEELLMRVHSADKQLDEMIEAMQSYMHDGGHEDAVGNLEDYMSQKGFGEWVNQFKKDKSLIIPTLHADDQAEGERVLRQWSDQLDQMNLENEYQRLTSTIHSGEADEAMLERMMLLQREIQAKKSSYTN